MSHIRSWALIDAQIGPPATDIVPFRFRVKRENFETHIPLKGGRERLASSTSVRSEGCPRCGRMGEGFPGTEGASLTLLQRLHTLNERPLPIRQREPAEAG